MNKAEISAIPDMQALRAAIDALDLRLAGLLAERTLRLEAAREHDRAAIAAITAALAALPQ